MQILEFVLLSGHDGDQQKSIQGGRQFMATLIPAISACVSRMTSGERRVAERLEQKLHADYLAQAHKEDFAWGDMAALCADFKTRDLCARTLAQRKLPLENRLGSGNFDPNSNKIEVMTMKVSKGLELPVVALPGVGHMPAAGEDEKEAARVFYVAATRATQRLVMGVGGESEFGKRLPHAR
ncbi:3'-5' exonuclease [Rhodoferax mekongensis]|uniref:DNA 3'-5' helicase II n=1 Tax=Rhodoferax mekongensis TaxID=3068341 RepID=A0ABZ0B1B5_9BURK|nr:3'-5' exonuclease [Rhodoferax sp. TBRC 17307]WNO05529.1 3'-5' exonuclease [Rhodoferax sp. TBRC 17307]